MSECDSEASIIGRAWSIRGCCAMGGNMANTEVIVR
jgi:hypothetical protein